MEENYSAISRFLEAYKLKFKDFYVIMIYENEIRMQGNLSSILIQSINQISPMSVVESGYLETIATFENQYKLIITLT